jgi:hypothetical protein
VTIAYDVRLRQPGCAILQAAMGATMGIANHFDSKTWLLHPTPDMRLYEVTEAQLPALVRMTCLTGMR